MVHAAYEGSIDPTVASAPVAVLAVGRLIGSHVVLVAPPEPLLLVEESTGKGVTAPAVHHHRVVGIAAVACDLVDLHIERHRHLDGIDPSPPTKEFAVGLRIGCRHLVVQILDHLGNLLLATTLHIALGIGLAAALVVGIVGLHTVAGCPLVKLRPAIGVVDVARIRVNLIECHQSFVVDSPRPKR